MSKLYKLAALGLMLCLTAGVNLGCNTTEGAGEDIGALGDGIRDAAD